MRFGPESYENWLYESERFARWLEGPGLVLAVGIPMFAGWPITRRVAERFGLGVPFQILLWLGVTLLLYGAATIALRLWAGMIDSRRAGTD